MALDALLKRCRAWKHPHLLGTKDLSKAEITLVLDAAEEIGRLKDEAPLKGKRLFNFFVEPSTRTKTSFALAARRLGAEVVDFSPSHSSLTKGESLKDTARTIESMGVAFTVIRHSASGAPAFLSRLVHSSVINAGDGANEHPTQALLDLFTMRQRLGKISGLKVALVGDITHSRVARSNLWALRKLGNEVTLVGPSTLVPKDLDAPVTHDFDRALREHHVVMMLRLQLERQQAGLFPSTSEYVKFFGLTRDRLATVPEGTIIMHPGPMNRGLEISAEAADSDRSVILNQVANGVAIRAAVLLLLSQVNA
ncbi:MAG TPA: aspartate carbamoyltransferase catalytic subunit [Planctomycetota bacterium]|nr:aspartate carbamoyltransferase catalytic subunit [Planctomycetota bacterium]